MRHNNENDWTIVLSLCMFGRDMNANGRFICMMKRNGRRNKNERHILSYYLDKFLTKCPGADICYFVPAQYPTRTRSILLF